MIPADNFHDNGDGTAWWVPRGAGYMAGVEHLDRPCEGCGGDCEDGPNYHTPIAWHCPDCIDGRHTFEIDVEARWDGDVHPATYRVSIVPGVILPIIHNNDAPLLDGARFVEMWDDHNAAAWIDGRNDGVLTLPPAAAPGLWAIQLKVTTP